MAVIPTIGKEAVMPKLKYERKAEFSFKKIIALVLSMVLVFSSAVLTANIIKNVLLKDGERELRLKTYSTSTASILSQAQISLQHADEVKRSESDDTIFIEVLRAFPVRINYHKEPQVVLVTGGTVKDALQKAELELTKNDVASVPITTKVYEGMSVDIDEVIYSKKSEYKEIDFDTSYKYTEDYPEGFEEMKTKGKVGTKKITTTYKYVNGEYIGAVGEVETVVCEPVTQVVLKGTAQTEQVSNISGSTHSGGSASGGVIEGLSYIRVLTGSATAYTASEGALTATGVPAYVGGVAVNPNIIPYGSKLYIVADGYTYGYATAVDTGGALMNGSALVDLYMSTYDECINFGRRNVTVYVLS